MNDKNKNMMVYDNDESFNILDFSICSPVGFVAMNDYQESLRPLLKEDYDLLLKCLEDNNKLSMNGVNDTRRKLVYRVLKCKLQKMNDQTRRNQNQSKREIDVTSHFFQRDNV